MTAYNIYHRHEKINKQPLTQAQVDELKSHSSIRKVVAKRQSVQIPVSELRIVKCVVF